VTDPFLPADVAEHVRRALLAVTLAELCQLDAATVLSPVCPHCAEGPAMALPGGQAFCGNDGCDVLIWRITDTPEQFEQEAKHLESHTDDAGRITWRPADDLGNPADYGLNPDGTPDLGDAES
jgi:hypothetical protein